MSMPEGEKKVLKVSVSCSTIGCNGKRRIIVDRRRINRDGNVEGITVFCNKCKNKIGNITSYNGKKYTGKSVESMRKDLDLDKLGIKIYRGEEARKFEAIYFYPKHIK